ncbi:MAG: LLM class flavin-dependent oxidoreductase [Rhodospirillaceae bacterium]|nr:LLM class flavin-dependent oxidoreductase [Rhodospirillaceae bacterium]MDD9915545.1 LLM class flavin-dependent oxidoreductase [Rhodospirillaceae bacterium]MDD9926774.1 LLM class flavin-dependent oxidoreductase [Rhodospirillaceae bacterium]
MTVAASRAPNLAAQDGLSALERAKRQPLMLGLFLPIQNGGWTISTAPRGTDWSFDYNARLIVQAEEAGFDLAFGLAQWLGAEGHGGATQYRKYTIDPLLVTSGVAALTRNIMLISTVHVLYGWHPLHLAKLGATMDHMTGGRWGLNLVTGFRPNEIDMFGLDPIPRDERYVRAAEFTEMLDALWRSEEDISRTGDYWSLKDAYVSPKPVNGRPILVNAGSSEAGLAYAAKYSDLIFITSPGGAEIGAALETLPAHTAKIKSLAAEQGREIRTVINPHVICRDTEREVEEVCQAILDGEDAPAVDSLVGTMREGDQASWRGHERRQRIIGGNIQIFGTPEQVVEQFAALKDAGCDGLQINFFDFAPDLAYFADNVLPLMKQAGLRN